MKIIAWAAAALIAAGTVTAAPADAQGRDYGWRDGRGWQDGRGYDRGRGWDDYRDDRRGGGWDRGRHRYGWDNGYGHARPRVVCRKVRGYYGRERRCFRVWR